MDIEGGFLENAEGKCVTIEEIKDFLDNDLGSHYYCTCEVVKRDNNYVLFRNSRDPVQTFEVFICLSLIHI